MHDVVSTSIRRLYDVTDVVCDETTSSLFWVPANKDNFLLTNHELICIKNTREDFCYLSSFKFQFNILAFRRNKLTRKSLRIPVFWSGLLLSDSGRFICERI